MGASWSNSCKYENYLHSGLVPKAGCKDGTGLSWSYSKLSPAPPRSEGDNLQTYTLKSFSFKELETATRNFHPDNVLEDGDFPEVFKGWIDEYSFQPTRSGTGMAIAVKKIGIQIQSHKKFLEQIYYLGQVRHPNVVRLIGYCSQDEHRLLVYEFVHRGSLDHHLFESNGSFRPLSWSLRMKIALGAAKGLAFLHSNEVPPIYKELNTCKILLNEKYEAKLSAFRLISDQQYDDDGIHVYIKLENLAYLAPKYISTGPRVTSKSDVFSFGVLLLEILSGRRARDMKWPNGEQMRVEWVKPFLSDKHLVFRVLDPHMRKYSKDHALKLAKIALKCLSCEPKLRPNMKEVVQELETLQELE